MLNSVQIMGCVVAKPEVFERSDSTVVRYRIVCDSDAKGQEPTYILVKSFGQNANYVKDHFHKGDLVVIDGRLINEHFERDGVTVYVTIIYSNRVYLARKKKIAEEQQQLDQELLPGKVRTGGAEEIVQPLQEQMPKTSIDFELPEIPFDLM